MTFPECVVYCAGIPEFVANLDRLQGTHLAQINRRTALERMIDDATQRDYAEDCEKFVAAVKDLVWDRLPSEVFSDQA